MQFLRHRPFAVAGIALACIIALLAIAVAQASVQRAVVGKVLSMASGTSTQVGSFSMHSGRATLLDVTMAAKGKPLAAVPRIDVAYNLHDLLPGSKHLYGLHAVTVYHPAITVVHLPDGSYNLPNMPKSSGPSRGGAPMNFTLHVIGGTLAVIDTTRVDPQSRRIDIGAVNINANVDTAARTTYQATMAYDDGNTSYPIRGAAIVDAQSGYTLHHWTAAHLPLAQIVNYALNNANMRMRAGFLDNLDAKYYGSISASATMRAGRITMSGVAAPIANVHGPVDMTSAGMTTPGITATVAGAPVVLTGGIYDLHNPQFRMTLNATSELARLKLLAAPAAKLPVRGPVKLSMLVEGSAKAPVAFISMQSPQLYYAQMPFSNASGIIAFDAAAKTAHVLNVGVQYAGFNAGVRGRMALENQPNAVEAFAHFEGPSGNVPFLPAIVPDMPLHGTLLASGGNLKKIDAQGVIDGNGSGSSLAGSFALKGLGTGNVALSLSHNAVASNDPYLAANIAIDRPHNAVAALVHARDVSIADASNVQLPGLAVKALPAVSGTMNGDVFALKRGNALGLAGDAGLRGVSYGKITIDSAHADFGGAPGAIAVNSMTANGSFGTLTAHGTISGTSNIALEGHLHGSLAAIGGMIGGKVPAHGMVDAPIALIYDNGRAVAQVQGARFNGASVQGVALNGLDATVGTQGKNINVYAAHARFARTGSAVAVGNVGSKRSNVALSVSNYPVMHGTADLGATATGSLSAPSVNGAAVVRGIQYGRFPVSAGTAFAYGGSSLTLSDALVGLGPAYATIDGTVGGIAMGQPMHPTYDLVAQTRAADVNRLLPLFAPKLAQQYVEGAIDARVHVGGAGNSPLVAGTFDAPAGSVHGLAFRNLHGTIGGTPQDVTIDNGGVTVGTTRLGFNAAVAGHSISTALNAPRADLSDFNDYFDTGDTFAGTGRVAMAISSSDKTFSSSGNVALQNVRFRRFAIGTSNATWSTVNQLLTARANIGGQAGLLNIDGTVALPRTTDPTRVATGSTINMRGSLRNLDLGTWLPLLGYNVPVTGRIDADATARGHYPDVDMGVNASLVNATVGRVQVQQAQLALNAQRGRGQIQSMIVRIPNLVAQGSGTFGLHANDPLALQLRATSPDVGKLLTTVNGKTNAISGAIDTTLAVSGTRAAPQIRDQFALTSLHYNKLAIPKITATLAGNTHIVNLQHGEVDLARGRVIASGSVPLRSGRNAPVAFTMNVQNVDFSDFESALPKGYRLAGTMAGTMRVAGTMDDPLFDGAIALHNGYFVGPIDQNPIQKMNGTLAFNRNTIAIQALHANVGGGTMDVAATAVVSNFRNPKESTFSARIVTKGAQINSPQYFRGKIDANVTATRAGGNSVPMIAGTVNIPSARIPLTAFWNPHAPKSTPKPAIPLAFNLRATVGDDVRVQSNGVDVGAKGAVAVAGTLANPTLSGNFRSTGGTIDFLRRFNIENAYVHFDPSNGIMPEVNALATTDVTNPVTTIALHVTGLAPNNMHLAFDSTPGGYSQTQLMAMLSGLNNPGGTGGFTSFSASDEVSNLALGEVNTLFTQQMLEPLSAALGNALGLQNLQLTDDFTSGFGVSAVKAFGKHITAVFAENLGEPRQESLSIQAHRGNSTSFALTTYSVDSPPALATVLPGQTLFGGLNGGVNPVLMPLMGTSGFTMTYQHEFQ